MRLVLLALVALAIVATVRHMADDYTAKLYQAHAVRCAQTPDMPGCDTYTTAAGSGTQENK